jgi:hypothetical protein
MLLVRNRVVLNFWEGATDVSGFRIVGRFVVSESGRVDVHTNTTKLRGSTSQVYGIRRAVTAGHVLALDTCGIAGASSLQVLPRGSYKTYPAQACVS